ncbi:T9SS type B sorting domain-containing protein [Capnocytophaga stomatis]|uniref:T9SS type B sorting domain-containing protein n=1 Tax=Capnocytophaga stomatis TaxID=1848904 RepID=A0ABW8QC94_9FLAO
MEVDTKTKNKSTFMKRAVFILYVALLTVFSIDTLSAQHRVPFGIRYQTTVKGDMLLVGNSILNVNDRGAGHTNPNLPYKGDHGNNSRINLDYIDIDGDRNTFNSSSARIQNPNSRTSCLKIKKAYLYWSAAYTQERMDNQRNPRFERSKFAQVKFKTPNSGYHDLVGDVVYDGFDIVSQTSGWSTQHAQRAYVYVKDVTSLLEAESTRRNGAFDGNYTVANIMAPKGKEESGVGYAAGWTLIVVYEDQTQASRHITLFDGFSSINIIDRRNSSLDIPVSGFQTIPSGNVNAKFAFAALEGELGIVGDALRIKSPSRPNGVLIDVPGRNSNTYYDYYNTYRANFFNSKITDIGGENLNRTPASKNLLGFDAGIFEIPNTGNSLIRNNSNSATITPSTEQDSYYPFMFAFNVEVIAPVIDLEKKVFKVNSNRDVTGGSVDLGDKLRYEIKFRNSGNDDARDLVITDKLPKNLLFENIASIKLPWTSRPTQPTDYEYNAANHEIKFKIPNDKVKKGQKDWHKITFEMKVPDHCDDLRDACSNVIANIVHAKYFGVQNRSSDGFQAVSVISHQDCEGNLTGPSTFIANLGNCVSKTKRTLCEKTLDLVAGANFDTYAWTKDGVAVPGGNQQTLTATSSGTYRVLKKKQGCADMTEEITVELHDNALKTNPINPFASEVFKCGNDNTDYPQIYLCGTSASKLLTLNVTEALSYKWEKRNENCTVPTTHPKECPVRDNYGCTWSQVHTGRNYNVSEPGDYRVEITYDGGCVAIFYFKVTKTLLTPTVDVRDIICNTQGKITVTHPATGYEYALQSSAGNIVQNYQNSNVFNVANPDSYTVLIRQKLVSGATYQPCVFEAPASIVQKASRLSVDTTPLACEGSKGTLRVQVLDAYPQYTYTIRKNNVTGAVVAGATATNTSDITFTGLDEGEYYVEVNTPDCKLTGTGRVGKIPPLQARVTVKSHLMCDGKGIVRVDAWDGTPGNSYAYSIDGGNTYFYNYADSFYEFTVSNPGTYTIKVVDANNCEVEVTSEAVRAATPPTFKVVDKLTDCGAKGTIEFTDVVNPDGYQIKYSIDGGLTNQLGTKFIGLTPEETYTPTVIYGNGSVECTVSRTITLPPAATGRVIASAGVAQLIGCGEGENADKAQVRITNVRGGTGRYKYSFDGGVTWGTEREKWLLSGTYTVIASDDVDCQYRTQVVVEPRPVNPVFTSTVTYNCDGTGNISIGSNQGTYSYTYTIEGVTTTTSTFPNLPPGTHNIKIKYADPTTPARHELFTEDFGVGQGKFKTQYINPNYFFEPQTRDNTGIYASDLVEVGGIWYIKNGAGTPQTDQKFRTYHSNLNMNDGEYIVTDRLTPNNRAWTIPIDHTGLTKGRMLFVNVGDVLGKEGGILYQREMIDVIPNQPIEFSIAVFNLINTRGANPTAADPDLTIELYTSEADILVGAPVVSQHIGSPPKSTNPNDWREYNLSLNYQGNSTKLYAVIRSGSLVTNGNDVAIDDILLYQLPKVCSFNEEINVVIEPNKEFGVLPNTEKVTNILCNDANNGSYEIALKNADPAGYWVSKDGGAFVRETVNPFVWNGISEGNHSVVFRYGENTTHCEVTRTFTVNNPSQITIQPIADLTLGCNPASVDLAITASGGVGALQYAVKQPDGTVLTQSSPNFVLTQAGDHEVTVTDANNCSATSTFKVNQAPNPTVTIANTSNYCVKAGTPAKIDVEVTNGTPPFTYSINGNVQATTNDASFSFGNLQPNTYTIKVVDKYGCEGTLTEVIEPELKINNAVVEKDITCDTAPNDKGRIKVSFTGGYAPYKYNVKKGNNVVVAETAVNGTEVTFETEEAGVYAIQITDSKGCEAIVSKELVAPQNPTVVLAKEDVKCHGESTGSIVVTTTNGTPPYRYFVNSIDRGNQNEYHNLKAGTYTITVRDAKNCEVTESVTIAEPAAPLAINAVIKKLISCNPAEDKAEVEYTVTGGTPNYSDNQGGTNYATEPRTIKLSIGTHNIVVTDANGCQVQTQVVVPQRPTPPTVNATPTINYNCDGTGNFTITATPDTYNYTYTLGTVTNDTGEFNNIAVGTHQVGIQYKEKNPVPGAEDCGYTMTVTVTVEPNKEFKANLASVTNASCNGVNDAQATINVENFGAGGYTYTVDGGAPQNGNNPTITILNLSAGVHTVTLVYDTCTLEVPLTVTQPDAITLTGEVTVPAKCSNGEKATVTLQAQGGTPPYKYIYNGLEQSTNVFTQVSVGQQQIFKVKDKNNCEQEVKIDIEAPKNIEFTAVPTACYSGNNDAEIVVTVTNGNGDYRFSINNGAWQTPSATTPLTYTFTGLPSSTGTGHIIRVEDAFGCSDTKNVVIHPPLLVTIKETPRNCNNGEIEVTATGGDGTYEFAVIQAGTAPTYTQSASPYNQSITTAGDYDVYVKSAECTYSKTVTIKQAPAVGFTATAKQPNCHGYKGSIALTDIVGDAPYTLNLYSAANPATSITSVSNYINASYEFSDLEVGTYIVTVTDRYGCTHTETRTLTDKPELTANITLTTTGCVKLNDVVELQLSVTQALIDAYTALGYKIEYSTDGTTWTQINNPATPITGKKVGETFTPSLRVVNTTNNIICLQVLPKYTVPFPLSELAVATNLIRDFSTMCTSGGFTVEVTASGGAHTGVGGGSYQFTMEDPFDPATVWKDPTPIDGSVYTFTGLVPGRTYTFYVRDVAGCIEKNSRDIYENYIPPVKVEGNVKPICFDANTGSIDFTVSRTATSTTNASQFDWILVNKTTSTTVRTGTHAMPTQGNSVVLNVPNLPIGTYYMEITEKNPDTGCKWASRDVEMYKQTELQGIPEKKRDVTCALPGLVEIKNPHGGGGTYTFTLTSNAFNNPIVSNTNETVIEVPVANISTTATSITIKVEVVDQHGCRKELGEVTMPVEQSAPAVTAKPDSCEEPLSITAEYTPVTGRNYEFAIQKGTGAWSAWQKDPKFTNLEGGQQYKVKLIDRVTGCESESPAVTLLTKIKGEVKQTKLLGCGQNAEIEIKASEGSGTYQYEVSGAATVSRQDLPATTHNYTVSVAGTYIIKLWDKDASAATCPPLTFTVTVADPVYPAFTASTVSATCNGVSDGKILINEVATGAPTVTYTIPNVTPAPVYNPTIKGFENLAGGVSYTVRATSANGCHTETTVTVAQPDAVNVAADFVTVKQFACTSGNTPVSAEVTLDPSKVTGGTPPYSFTIMYNGRTVNGTQLITNDHTGGTVTVEVRDANGCTTVTPTATIDKFDALTGISINITQNISCKVNENIDVLVTTTDAGTAINNNQKIRYIQSATVPTTAPSTWTTTVGTFNNLTPGTYTFWAGHIETGCMTSVTHTVKEPNTFVVTLKGITPPKCVGDRATVVFTVEDDNYTGDYEWQVRGTHLNNPTRTSNREISFEITKGSYFFVVKQVAHPECDQEYEFTVTEPEIPLQAERKVKKITCNGNDGAIEVINAKGGWGGYQYRITPDANATGWTSTPLFTGLSPAYYRVYIKDIGGCEILIGDANLERPQQIVANLTVDTQNCVAGSGVIKATASGGEGKNYTFQLIKNGVNFGTPVSGDATNSATFNNLSAGEYTVRVTDTWGCDGVSDAPVKLYEPITNPTVKIDKQITCTQPEGATITIEHQGGNSGNINYVVTPPAGGAPITQSNPVFTGLNTAGTYNVTVTDVATGCPPVTTTFELTPTVAVTFTHTQTNVSCNGGSDGSFVISLDNTQTQLNYKISVTSTVAGFTPQEQTVTTVPVSHTFSNLKAGIYQVVVTSARGCEHPETITIDEPTQLTATAAVTTAFACDATSNVPQQAVIKATVNGGTAPFRYSIDGVNFENTTGEFSIADTGAVQNITVTVKDANGCSATAPVVLNPLPKITNVTVDRKALTCEDPEEVKIKITGAGATGYQIEAKTTVTGAVITPAASQTLAAGTSEATFSLSKAGQYEFKVIDLQTGCYTVVTHVVNAYDQMKVSATIGKEISCSGSADGEIKLETVDYVGSFTWQVIEAATVTSTNPTVVKTGTGNATVFGTPLVTTIGGLSAGDYVVKIKQNATPFCEITSPIVQIANPQALVVTPTITNPLTCKGNDAVLIAEAQGGWGNYEYRLEKNGAAHPVYGTYSTTSTFVNLDAGNYKVWVKDKGGCEKSADREISAPTPINVIAVPNVTRLTCFEDKSANITATVTPANAGSGNYKYILLTRTPSGIIESGAQDSPTFTGLGAGEYAVRVVDGWNCDKDSDFVTIDTPAPVRVEAIISRNITCKQDAEITLIATGGSGTGYVFTVDPSSVGNITPSGTAGVYLAKPGTYVFTAVDGNGCKSEMSNTIEIHPVENLGLKIDTSLAYVKCNGDSSATIKAEAYGGLGDYKYELLNATGASLSPPVTNTDGVFGGLATGTYNVKVTSLDCEEITPTPIVINEAPALVFATLTSTNETCFNEKDGTINVEATGGTGAITYAISPRLDRVVTAEYIRSQKYEPGTYVVIAQDENGCTLEHEFVIAPASKIEVTLVSVTHETCLGSNDGSATISITGGTPPYYTAFNSDSDTANWVEGKLVYNNLPAGENHAIFVKDASGCKAYVVIPKIEPGIDLQLKAEATPQCSNDNVLNNRVVVSVNPTYATQVTYSLDGGTPQRSNIFDNVPAGVHTITVSHPDGCNGEVPVTMPNYTPLSVVTSTTEITCSGANDATITLQVTGGSSSYTYTITPQEGNFDVTTQKFTSLPAGSYTVVVRDNVLGCIVTERFRFVNPDPLYLEASTVSETCYGDNDGQIRFEIKGGKPTYSYVLTNPQGQQVDVANGIAAGQVVTKGGLAPGAYVLTYVDLGGVCTKTETITVGAAPNLKPINQLEVKYECTTSIPSNYLQVVFDNAILNQTNTFYALNSTNIADARRFTEFNGSTAIIRNLPAGSDQFITIFHNTCSYTIPLSEYFDVQDFDPLTLQDKSDPRKMNQIKVQANGGKAPYTYYFNGRMSSSDEYYISSTDPGRVDANGRIIKQIEVMVIDDLGCSQTITIEKEFVDIHIPNYFTPNNDGNNDRWKPENTRSYPNIEVIIYDRYGRLIATLRQDESWDGKYNTRDLPTGDYWYLVKLNGDGDEREFIGNFTLFR